MIVAYLDGWMGRPMKVTRIIFQLMDHKMGHDN